MYICQSGPTCQHSLLSTVDSYYLSYNIFIGFQQYSDYDIGYVYTLSRGCDFHTKSDPASLLKIELDTAEQVARGLSRTKYVPRVWDKYVLRAATLYNQHSSCTHKSNNSLQYFYFYIASFGFGKITTLEWSVGLLLIF